MKKIWLPLAVLALALISLLAPAQAHAFGVLGCNYNGGNPQNFVNCINRAAENRANDVRRQMEQSPLHAKGEAEARLLAAARNMPLDALFSCLSASGALSSFQADVELARRSPEELLPVIAARIDAQLRTLVDARLEGLVRTMTSGDEPPSAATIAASLNQLQLELIKRVPGLSCLERTVGFDRASIARLGLARAAEVDQRQAENLRRMNALMEDLIRRSLERAMIQAAGNAAGGAAWLASKGLSAASVDTEAIANRAFVRHMMQPSLERARTSLEALSRGLAGGSAAEVQALRAAALRDLQPDERMRTAALIQVGADVMRDLGSTVIKSDFAMGLMTGGTIFDTAAYLVKEIESAGLDAGCSAAGLVPEAGAFAYSVVRYVAEAGAGWAKVVGNPVLKAALGHAINEPWRSFMNDLREAVIAKESGSGDAQLNALRRKYPQFTALVDTLTRDVLLKTGSDYIRQLERSLAAHQRSVSDLVSASGSR